MNKSESTAGTTGAERDRRKGGGGGGAEIVKLRPIPAKTLGCSSWTFDAAAIEAPVKQHARLSASCAQALPGGRGRGRRGGRRVGVDGWMDGWTGKDRAGVAAGR